MRSKEEWDFLYRRLVSEHSRRMPNIVTASSLFARKYTHPDSRIYAFSATQSPNPRNNGSIVDIPSHLTSNSLLVLTTKPVNNGTEGFPIVFLGILHTPTIPIP